MDGEGISTCQMRDDVGKEILEIENASTGDRTIDS